MVGFLGNASASAHADLAYLRKHRAEQSRNWRAGSMLQIPCLRA